ncbi:ABC transporter permease [Oscillospiraceae bacterium HCP3S3_D12]|jgi:putative ABC transport system permease protein|uniref:ABC transporter permease n=1 Tax=Oscillospiraceae TaxID=216572 RepID=UPI002426BEF1|nr:ABC transporter permease [Ruminococcus bromii]MCI7624830.1 ABC transporter permease [Bacillota bacterium]MDD6328945.1 ABC transporter permease [Bacillota bacterium]MDE8727994.1 ABC transporter permease [Ruminococcus bromii]
MIENIRLSFQGIWSHKMRSFLTMLGIIIGIASIISIVSTIKGTNEQIKKNLIGSGTNTVQIQLYQGDYQYEMLYNGLPDGIPVRDETTMEKIKSVKNVEDAAFYTSRSDYNNSVYYGNNGISGSQVFGVDNSYFTTNGLVLKSGRTFVDSDFTDFHAAAIIDADTADSLFDGENPIGKTIEISSIPFTVVGIVDEDSKFEPVINSIDEYYTYYSDSSASRIFVPSSMWPALYSFDEPQNVAIRVSNTEAMTDAGKAVAEIMNANVTNSEIKYQAQDLLKQAQDLQDLSSSTNSQLIWIASISLLVGGIGVMNIMLVSVTERTREIGLKKAIGAKKSRILWQFLTEAAVLTSLGGIVGVGAGIGLAEIISRVTSAPVAISVPSIIIAVVFSMVIGIIFGLLPSFKAANLNPIDALRHE